MKHDQHPMHESVTENASSPVNAARPGRTGDAIACDG